MRIYLWTLLLAIVVMCVNFMYVRSNTPKIAVIDVYKLVNEFKMKKDLEEVYKLNSQVLIKKNDSLKNALQFAMVSNNQRQIQSLNQEIGQCEQELSMYSRNGSEEVSKKVWERLNPYIDSFGKKNKYKLLVGGNGMGSVLYCDGALDVTQEVLKFVNGQYEGGN
jgi:Skp family chaperone for outer membrane proteins